MQALSCWYNVQLERKVDNTNSGVSLLLDMVSISVRGCALRWSFFFTISSITVFIEFANLFFSQLGLSSSQIGMTTFMGVQHLFLPLFGFFGDKFRARRFVLGVLTMSLFLLSIGPLLPLVVSFPTCYPPPKNVSSVIQASYSNETFLSQNPMESHEQQPNHTSLKQSFSLPRKNNLSSRSSFESKKSDLNFESAAHDTFEDHTYLPWISPLFIYLALIKILYSLINRALMSLCNVATITYLKGERAKYGLYFMWGQFGSSISLLSLGLLANFIQVRICGKMGNGYFVTFFWSGSFMLLSLLSLPWIKYEYLHYRVISWSEVRDVFSKPHYLLISAFALYFGCCTAFPIYWEFWYIGQLHGSPVVMGAAGMVRRPLAAIWYFMTGKIIAKFGDLKTMALGLLCFAISFLSISLITTPWLVLLIDFLQSAGAAFGYCAVNVHFSKPGSKASSAIILGIMEMVYAFGVDAGSSLMGIFFHAIGSKQTLFYLSILSAVILVVFLGYVYFNENVDDYEAIPSDSDDDEDICKK